MEKNTNKGEQAFINALLSLMEEKPYNQISVSELPEELAQVSEFSRYAYYFTLGGLWQMLVLWIRDGMTLTPEQLTDYVLTSFSEMQKMI